VRVKSTGMLPLGMSDEGEARGRHPRGAPAGNPPPGGPSGTTPPPEDKLLAASAHVDAILRREGTENLYELRRELRACMDKQVGVFRTGKDLSEALRTVREIRHRMQRAPVKDKGRVYNSNLFHAIELENLVDLAEVTVTGALTREESRGAHARRDFEVRDDEKWLKHTLAWATESGPRLDYKRVTIDTWKPVERKY
jgi:succinate dehydrogenase/fumarate reductase flavoprotein subunit